MRLTDDGTRHLEIDEFEKGRRVSRGLYEASLVDGRVGHCELGRERSGALDWREGGSQGAALYMERRWMVGKKLTGRLTVARIGKEWDEWRLTITAGRQRSRSDRQFAHWPSRALSSPKLRERNHNL
jgi:hypothetical protein